ncbi:MAG: aldehyde dehydrogenase family protein [Vulcanimicrobiota bacterium]
MRKQKHSLVVAGKAWHGKDYRPVVNPWSGKAFAEVAYAGADQLEVAIAAASGAAREMRRVSRARRSGWCLAIAQGLEARKEEFAQTLMSESGKPIRLARDEVTRAISTFTFAAHEALKFGGEFVPLDVTAVSAGYQGMTQRFGAGPVAAITPFNFPLNLVAHKVAPALAVGNPVILKPAPNTPLTSLLLSQLVLEAGVPPAGFSCLNLDIAEIEKLVDDPRVPIVSFTGSAKVGWSLRARAGQKRVILELGGNASVIVHGDANLEHALPRLAAGGYAYSGQVCISVQHILVERSIYADFLEGYVAEVGRLKVGDPSLEPTMVGPLIRPQESDRIDEWVQEALAAGARLHCGGQRQGPCYLPTVLSGVPSTTRIGCEEVFGPVTTVDPYDTWEEAVERVNSSKYGLQVGVFTRDLERVLSSWEELECGGVIVNDYPTFRVDNMPYGGVKQSGAGREGVFYTMEEMSEPRLLVLNRNPLR